MAQIFSKNTLAAPPIKPKDIDGAPVEKKGKKFIFLLF